MKPRNFTCLKTWGLIIFLSISANHLFAQSTPIGRKIAFDFTDFKASKNRFSITNGNGLIREMLVKLPMPDGTLGEFLLTENKISDNLIPNVQTFDGISMDGKSVLKLTILQDKIEGLMHNSDGYFIIEPASINQKLYVVYGLNEIPKDNMKCGSVDETVKDLKVRNERILGLAPFPVGTQLRIYKMAASATGEMTAFYSGKSGAISQIVSIINSSNLIYELEAAIRFQLSTATTDGTIVFTDGNTDPFTVDPTFASALNSQTGFTALNTSGILTYATYNVGHTFNTLAEINGGYSISGQAGPTPCMDASKSRGWTQWTLNAALGAIVNVFVHEVGHQFSAQHTYNAVGGPSSGSTFCTSGWSSTSAIEPGSGSTLMGYGNNCISPNYTLSGNNSLNYFHTKSLESIYNFVNSTTGSCFTASATNNTPPVANAGSDLLIPKGTPFKLAGSATDVNGDALSYTWEQYDVATANDKGAFGNTINGIGGYTAVNSTTAPLFRSELSAISLERTFPKLTHILNSSNNPADSEGEDLPQVARSLKFRFTVRDNKQNGGGIDSDETLVTVTNDGPFLITSQNNNTLWIYNGTNTATVTWSVNNTNITPLSVANIKISFSTDGGNTFPIILSASTSNDGSEIIVIPNNVTSQGRIKIEPVGNYAFFDMNNSTIFISNTCAAEITTITPATALTAIVGDASLNLGQSAYGTSITSFTGAIQNTDPQTNMIYSNAGVCNSGNTPYYNIYSFRVLTQGDYTFTKSSGTLSSSVLNIYSGTYSASNPCNNWLNSSATFCSPYVCLSNAVTTNLAPGVYYLVVSGFSNANLGSYTITPTGGTIYNLAPSANSPYAYTFPVVNSAGNIVTFNDNTNLTNTSTYFPGSYTIYGLSYQRELNLTSYIGRSFSSFQNLITTNSICGKISTNARNITINCLPINQPLDFTTFNNRVCKSTNNVIYTVPVVSGATSYTWSYTGLGATIMNNGNSASINFSSTATSGTLSVLANNTCTSTVARTSAITLNANPVATASSNSPVNVGANIVLQSSGGVAYTWNGVNGFSSTVQNPTLVSSSALTSGTYQVKVTNQNGCTAIATTSVLVNINPVSTIVISIASGNWDDNSIWNIGRSPRVGDIVLIDNNHIVNLSGTGNSKCVQYRGTGKLMLTSKFSLLNLGI